ncbi:ABC transporter ATP-binding protein [Gemelliphila asaccharolytica]|uniref:Bacteriocin export ABC transporter n=1 Tax=Gemelliphila asaccharolytica TaxID=502393 RepID=A0ABR5TMZ9_9BACL|nr:ABC transporter ATP-binding protein [Gemella asaccharolytica]KXB58224.1 putative bacteriocin export ABC transporter [Gemella asaccharolytica]
MLVLELKNIKKEYKTKKVTTKVLKGINLSVEKGEFISIMGESGSGKTTLLNVISTLDKASSGKVTLNGKDINSIKDKEISKFRREELGFVFQDFNLLNQFDNKDNILLPLVLSNVNYSIMTERLAKLSEKVGIKEILEKYPYEISGGQKQRVAITRALITNPSLLLADEPTGALDSSSSNMILNLFEEINTSGQTILMVTHSLKASSYSKRVVFIKDGILYHEIYRGENESREEFEKRIGTSQLLLSRGDI